MVLVDVNLLIHATILQSPEHQRARAWWDALMLSNTEVALPWAVLMGFVRVSTNARALTNPQSLDKALSQIDAWLALPGVSVLHPGPDHPRLFAECCRAAQATGNLVSDAHLAALAMEHDCELASNDTDFARFPGLRWRNPLAAA